jgi:hypothetical protein
VRDEAWLARVNEPLSARDLQRQRQAVKLARAFGDESLDAGDRGPARVAIDPAVAGATAKGGVLTALCPPSQRSP